MTIEVARHLAGLEGADSSEFNPEAPHHVIATMAEQLHIVSGAGDLGGSMRLGSYPAELQPGLAGGEAVRADRGGTSGTGTATRSNNAYRADLEAAGLVISGCRRTPARWSSSSCRPGASLLRGHPGPPGN